MGASVAVLEEELRLSPCCGRPEGHLLTIQLAFRCLGSPPADFRLRSPSALFSVEVAAEAAPSSSYNDHLPTYFCFCEA